MTARIVGAELPASDFRESFPARDLKVSNDPATSHAVAKSVRYIHCAECGATFYRPSEDWAYKIYDMDYDRARAKRYDESGAELESVRRYVEGMGCHYDLERLYFGEVGE